MVRISRLFVGLVTCCGIALASVTITESTPQRLTFTWTLDTYRVDVDRSSAGSYSSIVATGTNVDLGEAGAPAIPGFSFLVGVPPKGMPSISLTPLETRSVRLDAPIAPSSGNPKIVKRPSLAFADGWISNPKPSVLGRLRNVGYMIRPFAYDPNSLSMSVLTKATITVTFPPVVGPMEHLSDRSEFNQALSRLILNYAVAQNWAHARPGRLAKKAAGTNPFVANANLVKFAIGDGHDGYNEGMTNENGLLKIAGRDILGALGGSTMSIADVALFGSVKGELNSLMPDSSTFPDGIVAIPLLKVDLNHNGILDPDDYVLACVTGNSDWAFDTVGAAWNFNLNRFDDYRHYWLSKMPSGARTMPRFSCDGVPVTVLTSAPTFACYKRSLSIPSDDREGSIDWVWQKLNANSPVLTVPVDLSMIQKDSVGYVSVESGWVNDNGAVTVLAGDSVVDTPSFSTNRWFPVPAQAWTKPSVTVRYTGSSAHEVASIRVEYYKRLDLSTAAALAMYSPTGSGVVQYRLTSVPPNREVYVVRVPVDESKTSCVIDTTLTGSDSTITWNDTIGKGIRYYVATSAGLLASPAYAATTISPTAGSSRIQDLKNTGNSADYLVVYHPAFEAAAGKLVQHKQSMGRFQAARMVSIDDIYQQFSGGNIDPAGLRNFLFYAYNYWTAPSGVPLTYVVLLGSGNYDFKGVLNRSPCYLPVCEVGATASQKCYEDYFTHLTPATDAYSSDSASIFLGRLPATSAAGAQSMVDKIRESEDPSIADFGGWRNRVLLVADDDMQGAKPDPLHSSTPHYRSSEVIANTILRQAPAVDLRKIYLYDYPVNELYEKPGAARALINEINNGVSYVNWFGHGDDDVWADEHILTKQDMSGFTNAKKYPVINSFSCSVGKFDYPDPERTCLSALVVGWPEGGGIAAISSTRLAYAQSNEALANYFYGILFDSTSGASLGQAYLCAKEVESNPNFDTYALLGDPSYQAVAPTHQVLLTIVDQNNKPLDTLSALQRVTVRGTVVKKKGPIDASFGTSAAPAQVQISLFNPMSTAFHIGSTPLHDTIRYPLPGIPLFLAQTQVLNGMFEQTLLLPRNVAFGKAGAKLTAYVWQKTNAGTGYNANISFAGTSTSHVSDTTGPVISIRLDYDEAKNNGPAQFKASFQDGVTASLPLKGLIDVYDENGVDVSGVGPDEGLTMEIPGLLSRRSINNVFQFDQGSFQRGSAPIVFEEGQLKAGQYTLCLSAQDLLGNVAKKNITLTIVDKEAFTLGHVFNYPNPFPMRTATKFFYYQAKTATSWDIYKPQVTIRIYSMSGKLLKLISSPANGEPWYGTDQAGRELGPNVYLYQVTARATDGSNKTLKSPIMKLVIGPPR